LNSLGNGVVAYSQVGRNSKTVQQVKLKDMPILLSLSTNGTGF